MKQIVYVDVYFILNFIINFFLMIFTAFFRQKKRQWKRWAGISLLVAGVSTGLLFFHGMGRIFMALAVPLQIGLLIFLGFPYEGGKVFCKDVLSFVLLACLSGGIITAWFHLLFQVGKGYSAVWFLASLFLLFFCMFLLRMEFLSGIKRQKTVYMVRIFLHGDMIEAKGLYDTGNHLVSPYTGEGVVVISKDIAKNFSLKKEKFQFIPYRSIGGKGLLTAFRVDAIEILEKGEKRENVLVAISDSLEESSEIKVILNLI